MLTKGAIGNLVNRYRAVLAKCNLINTFGSLAVAAMLVLGGAGVAMAEITNFPAGEHTLSSSPSKGFNIVGDEGSSLTINAAILNYGSIKGFDNLTITGPWAIYFDPIKGDEITNETTVSIESDNIILNGSMSSSSVYIASTSENAKIEIDFSKKLHITGRNAISNHGKNCVIEINGGDNSIFTTDVIGNGIWVLENAEGSRTSVKADSVNITTGSYTTICGYAKNSSIEIEAKDLTLIRSADDKSVVWLDPSSEGTEVSIVATEKANIVGNLETTASDSSIALDVAGSESTFTGKTTLGSTAQINMSFDDATWNATGASSVTNLEMNGATVDMSKTDGDIEVANLTGDGGKVVMDAAKTNKFNVKTASEDTTVKAVATQNADNVTDEQAKEMVNRISGVENKKAEIEEGKTRGAMTVDANGKVTMAKNELMDAALQQASITMVSLDKILTNDVRKRLGDIRSDKNTTGVWMRWDGGKMKGDSGLTNNFNTIQIGGDTKAAKNCRIGFAGSFTHGDTEFSRGNGELEGFSFALYGTWMGENGMFADVVARLGKFSTEMNVDGDKGDIDNRVASLSAEYGWRFNVCQQFFVEPQVELAYTYVSSDDLQLGDAHYEFDSVDSLTGRAGVVAGWNLPEERGNVYARASVVQQFMGDAKISGSVDGGLGNVQKIDGEDTWLEYGIGANVKLTDSTYLWADVERTEGADIEEEWRGTVGVRFSF